MKIIDMEAWPRRNHFAVFNQWDMPHFNMCVNIDLREFQPFVKQNGISFNLAIIYSITRAANSIPEFRQRIRGDIVVEHDIVHPSSTIMGENDMFTFCFFEYREDFSSFVTKAKQRIAYYKTHPGVDNDPNDDNLLFMTAIPWVSFTSFMHPLKMNPVDSVPRFAWGMFYTEGNSIKMPLSVQGHHALMDGLHMGRFYEYIQDLFDNPKEFLI